MVEATMIGALLLTDVREIHIMVMGSTDPEVDGSVSQTQLDQVWSRLVSSLVIDE
jgi:hypothetical protein